MDLVHAPNFGCNVYAAGLPPDLNDQQLHDLFAPYGPITSARIMRAKATRASKGYGFVLFEDIKSASQAVNALNGLIIGGHRIQARLAHPDASNTLRKFAKRAASATSSADHSASVSPVFQGLSTPLQLPIMAPTMPGTLGTANYAFTAAAPCGPSSSTSIGNSGNINIASNMATQQVLTAAALPPFNGAPTMATTTIPTATLSLAAPRLNVGGMPTLATLGTQQLILPQQPVYIVMVSQDGQPTLNYPI